MSTRGSIIYHRDEARGIEIHIYEELPGDRPQDIRLKIEFDHAVINVPWPLGLTPEQVQSWRSSTTRSANGFGKNQLRSDGIMGVKHTLGETNAMRAHGEDKTTLR